MLTPTLAGIAMLIASVGFAGTAGAIPTGGGDAADTVRELRDDGYTVQINGDVPVPLSQCTTTAVHGIPNAVDALGRPEQFTTVYVDVSCPESN
jgi:hypothetical protein